MLPLIFTSWSLLNKVSIWVLHARRKHRDKDERIGPNLPIGVGLANGIEMNTAFLDSYPLPIYQQLSGASYYIHCFIVSCMKVWI